VDIKKITTTLLFTIVKDNLNHFLRLTILSLTIGVLVSILIQPRYDSNISFYTKKNDSSSGLSGFSLSEIMISGRPIANNHDFSILDILSSNDIYEELILYNFDTIDSNLIKFWEIDNNFFNATSSAKNSIDRKVVYLAIKKLKSRISFTENRKSGLISIGVSTEDKFLSKELADVLFNHISDLLVEVNSKKHGDKVKFLGSLSYGYKENLKSKEDDLVSFLVQNKNINNSEVLLAEKKRLEREITILSSTYYSILKDLEMAKISESDALSLLVVLDSPKIAHKKSYPPRKLIVLFFGFLGFTTALGFRVVRFLKAENN